MAKTIRLSIVSQDNEIFSGDVNYVNIPGSEGPLGIYPGHSPLITRINPGVVDFSQNNEKQIIYIRGGFVEVQPKVVNVLADVAIRGGDLDKERILKAKTSAEERLKHLSPNSKDFEAVAAKLKREIAKLRAYELMNVNKNRDFNKK